VPSGVGVKSCPVSLVRRRLRASRDANNVDDDDDDDDDHCIDLYPRVTVSVSLCEVRQRVA